jgi:hypothetical protein
MLEPHCANCGEAIELPATGDDELDRSLAKMIEKHGTVCDRCAELAAKTKTARQPVRETRSPMVDP